MRVGPTPVAVLAVVVDVAGHACATPVQHLSQQLIMSCCVNLRLLPAHTLTPVVHPYGLLKAVDPPACLTHIIEPCPKHQRGALGARADPIWMVRALHRLPRCRSGTRACPMHEASTATALQSDKLMPSKLNRSGGTTSCHSMRVVPQQAAPWLDGQQQPCASLPQ